MLYSDPLVMPLTGETPREKFTSSLPLFNTPGAEYVEKRGIPVDIAHAVNVRFAPDWNGRPAVIAPITGHNNSFCAVHGRYLYHTARENKMLTVGASGGVFAIDYNNSNRTEPVILVEGLFDALSLYVCGYNAWATIGRRTTWLPEFCQGKHVILAFDGNRPGKAEMAFYREHLSGASCHRLTPPGHSKDWNTALVKRGRTTVKQWISSHLTASPF
jgi:DNA primase